MSSDPTEIRSGSENPLESVSSDISFISSDYIYRDPKAVGEGHEKIKFQHSSLEDYQRRYVKGRLKLTDVIKSSVGGGGVMHLRFSDDGKFLAVGYGDGLISIYDNEGKYAIEKLKVFQTKQFPVTSLKFLKHIEEGSGILLATYASGHVAFWNLSDGLLSGIILEERDSGETSSAAFNHSATKVATVGADSNIIIYDIETKSVINKLHASQTQMVDGHNNRVFAVQFEPGSENVFITGGWDRTIHFWDSRQQRSFRHFYGPYICGDGIDIKPGSKNILTASWRLEDNLEVWDFGSAKRLTSIPDQGLRSHLYSAQWYGGTAVACVGSNGNIGRVVDRTTCDNLGYVIGLPSGIFCMDNDRQEGGPRLAFGSGSQVFVSNCDQDSI